jgi:hypothetical protein
MLKKSAATISQGNVGVNQLPGGHAPGHEDREYIMNPAPRYDTVPGI